MTQRIDVACQSCGLWWVVCLVILGSHAAKIGQADDRPVLRPHALPTLIQNSPLDLRIRELTVGREQRLAFVGTLVWESGSHFLFNPFGDPARGRPFSMVIVNADHQVVHHLLETTPASTSVGAEDWFPVAGGAIVGRCYWTGSDDTSAPKVVLPKLPAGRYSVYLLAHQRLLYPRPITNELPQRKEEWQAGWQAITPDDFIGASLPVHIEIANDGRWSPASPSGETRFAGFEPFESNCVVNPKGVVRAHVRFVTSRADSLLLPRLSLCAANHPPVRFEIQREDGAAFDLYSKPWMGSSLHPSQESDRVAVPEGGVVGGIHASHGTLPTPGRYLVSTLLDESVYANKVFVNGKRTRKTNALWPIVCRAPTVVVTVPEKPVKPGE